ncbi:FAD-dependent oxidoreductase [Noviherbaspirillum sp. Root189]|uniref:FAD-dependent oxidoreductase n=1 Tax=Noviherbaspirillum sp. Root189 TaxID=1736487 RepID=UPI0007091652|nr:FAD-dependent oxidoreductase [Noviherbaspirillum sp. Root189]KRB84856.1 FAD-dependent oxidoreductase [Noviherbaspirillum sp. Root189]
MEKNYQQLKFDYVRSPDEVAATPVRRPVVVVGAGPVGLSAAIDLAQQGIPVVVLDDDCVLSNGSRAICFAKRTLEIFDRLGCGDRMVEKGVSWNVGKVFYRDEMVYAFDLLPETGHRRPAFVNLQQYYVEGYLLERAQQLSNLDLRWKNKVVGVSQDGPRVELMIETPDGQYRLDCDYLIAADGSRSTVRKLCGLESKGRTFHDRFLIADVRMKAEFPPERWFWFDPPFHPNQSVLLHRQPDNVWRIDFQLGWDADPVAEKDPEKVTARVRALLGKDAEFELDWVSVYTFSCLRMEKFRHGRIFFAGDAAHGVSPFGARGANSGVQDADNLAWKLRLVIEGKAPEALLESYCDEREFAADENILNSTRSTDFITPKSAISRTFRDAVLRLSKTHDFARKLVNSGRLSRPSVLAQSALNTPDQDMFDSAMVPGAPADDAPIQIAGRPQWFSTQLGNEFTGVYFCDASPASLAALSGLLSLVAAEIPVRTIVVLPADAAGQQLDGIETIIDTEGLLAKRYDARPGTFYLLRPDQHVCGRWRQFEVPRVTQAVLRATGRRSVQPIPSEQSCLVTH